MMKHEVLPEALTLRQAQRLVDEWIKTVGVRYFSELTNMAILTEEVGEVARIMARRYGEQSEKPSDANADLADELADVLWVLICLANQTGVDLEDALRKNLDKKSKRDADRHTNNPKLTAQYFSRAGSTCSIHANIPPSKLLALLKPKRSRCATTASDRRPDLQ